MDVFFVISWFLDSYKNNLIFFQKSGLKIWSVLKNALLLHPLSRTMVLNYKASIVAELLQQRFESKIFKIFCLKILQNQKPALSLQSVSERSQIDSSISRLFGLRPYDFARARHNQCIHCFCSRLLAKFTDSSKKTTVVVFS